ncbi:hypothetical protein GCM10023336_66250 [Streptomyces similanensis]|uniref:Uncharacterized protein n=1 Tax=Streptomyces similanensis TaxID=1274988 RepID=A0ABP9LDJ7_9ACTN
MPQTRACENFSAQLRTKMIARIASSSTTEMEIAIVSLLRRAHFAAFGRKCGVAGGLSGRLTRPPNVWFCARSGSPASRAAALGGVGLRRGPRQGAWRSTRRASASRWAPAVP